MSKGNICYNRGGFAVVWLGTLQLQKAKAAVKDLVKNGFLRDGETAKVNLLLSLTAIHYLTVSQGCYKDPSELSRRGGNDQGKQNLSGSTCSDSWKEFP